jgi:hypothetical protein
LPSSYGRSATGAAASRSSEKANGNATIAEFNRRSDMCGTPHSSPWVSVYIEVTDEARLGAARKKIETELGAQMEHATTHNTFNILFMVSFFASFLVVMLHFG